MFQVVPPCGGHQYLSRGWRVYCTGFKSCPRVGGIANSAQLRPSCKVSSRAPVWGASRMLRIMPPAMQFQVVPPCGGHPIADVESRAKSKFQVVPPCGGHLATILPHRLASGVSSRAPVWGASSKATKKVKKPEFQVVPPCGGHPVDFLLSLSWWVCFKSCPRVGGIFCSFCSIGCTSVSSRAPVWGASSPPSATSQITKVSSRAPVWGASSNSLSGRIGQECFKSCPRVGGISETA